MEISNSHGQSAFEVMIVMGLLAAVALLFLEFSTTNAVLFKPVQLSKDIK